MELLISASASRADICVISTLTCLEWPIARKQGSAHRITVQGVLTLIHLISIRLIQGAAWEPARTAADARGPTIRLRTVPVSIRD